MRLIVGLGNPGPDYAQTRHNAGFWFVDALALEQGSTWSAQGKLFGSTAQLTLDGQKIILFKPSTFMNESGKAVRAAMQFYKIEPAEMLVAHDELDIEAGDVRLKFDGGHGGQNGLRDIIKVLGGDGKFHRLRIGIGHPGHKDRVTGHVLGRPNATETSAMLDAIIEARRVLPLAISGKFSDAMTALHTKK